MATYGGEYFNHYSAPQISFRDRRASQAEFDQYWSKKKSVREEVSKAVKEELDKMPSAKPAGLDYYVSLNRQLFDNFCRQVAKAMIAKERNPELAKVSG